MYLFSNMIGDIWNCAQQMYYYLAKTLLKFYFEAPIDVRWQPTFCGCTGQPSHMCGSPHPPSYSLLLLSLLTLTCKCSRLSINREEEEWKPKASHTWLHFSCSAHGLKGRKSFYYSIHVKQQWWWNLHWWLLQSNSPSTCGCLKPEQSLFTQQFSSPLL